MEQKEISTFELLKDELQEGNVSKSTAIHARNIYNRYNPTKKVSYCMCQKVKRHVLATQFMEWYERQNR